MSRSLRTVTVVLCLTTLVQLGCTRLTRMPTLATDGNSDSGQSDDSSGQSNDSSGASADSSGASADSSDESGDSSASDDSDSKSESGSDDGDLLSTATVALAVSLVVLGVIYVVSVAGKPDVDVDAAARDEALASARTYLTDNRRRIRADIARGAGPFVDELALVHGLPPALRPRLGAALQRAHGDLDPPLAHGPPTDDATARFAVALLDAVRTDPALAPHLDAFEARLRAGAVALP